MSKTFDNISEASATNYLFIFSQRTLGLQNEPPTPPPLNALGLPCHALCLLWARVYPKNAEANKYLSVYLSIGAAAKAAEEKASAEKAAAEGEEEAGEVKAAATEEEKEAKTNEENDDESGQVKAATMKTFAEKIAPLAKKVTEYIVDHQDDAAQEDRWRTTMKREMGKNFKKQSKEVQEVQRSMQQRLAKMDEKLDWIVKDLAKEPNTGGD